MKSLSSWIDQNSDDIHSLEHKKRILHISGENLCWIKDNYIQDICENCFLVYSDKNIKLIVNIRDSLFNRYVMFLVIENELIADIEIINYSSLKLEECKQILLEKADILYSLKTSICLFRHISFDCNNDHLSLYNYGDDRQNNEKRYALFFDRNLNPKVIVDGRINEMKNIAEKLKEMHPSIAIEYDYILPPRIKHQRILFNDLHSALFRIRNNIE